MNFDFSPLFLFPFPDLVHEGEMGCLVAALVQGQYGACFKSSYSLEVAIIRQIS